MEALSKRDDKEIIIANMNNAVADQKLHSTMVKAACCYLIDRYGR